MQRTKASLHGALIALAREKPFPSIAVKEILDRANVGRSTFYTHFRDKHDLLQSGIYDLLQSVKHQPFDNAITRSVAFSLPLLRHIDQHRRATGAAMTREGFRVMHAHLRGVLAAWISDALRGEDPRQAGAYVPAGLLARHLSTTFVLVLEWWIEKQPALIPDEVDAYFRALVEPVLLPIR